MGDQEVDPRWVGRRRLARSWVKLLEARGRRAIKRALRQADRGPITSSSSAPAFRWNAAGWFGGQLGASLWILLLGLLLCLKGVAVGVAVLLCGTVSGVESGAGAESGAAAMAAKFQNPLASMKALSFIWVVVHWPGWRWYS